MQHLDRISTCLRIGVMTGVAALVIGGSARAAKFYVLPTDANGANSAFVRGVSADGSVVVGYQNQRPFRSTAASGFEVLELAPNFIEAFVEGISGDGSTIVGFGCCGGLDYGQAFRWSETTDMQALGVGGLPNNFDSAAHDASYDGSVIVGSTMLQPSRWTQAGGFVLLGSRGIRGRAMGISADGQVIVGSSQSDVAGGKGEAFRWTHQTGIEPLGDLAGGLFQSFASAVSADGQVVVGSGYNGDGRRAFRWTSETGMLPLPDAPGGEMFRSALAVSDDGSIIVGTNYYADALVWDAADGTRAARDILIAHGLGAELEGLQLTSVEDISADGRTWVGNVVLPDGNLTGWIAVVPEPSAGLLMLIGAIAMIGVRRPRRIRPLTTVS